MHWPSLLRALCLASPRSGTDDPAHTWGRVCVRVRPAEAAESLAETSEMAADSRRTSEERNRLLGESAGPATVYPRTLRDGVAGAWGAMGGAVGAVWGGAGGAVSGEEAGGRREEKQRPVAAAAALVL